MSLTSPSEIAAHLAKLCCLSVADLRTEWSRVLGGEPPKNAHREYLLRAIAYQAQAGSHGGLPGTLVRSLKRLCSVNSNPPTSANGPTRTLKPGARILREWKGAVHQVEVVDTGFRYGDRTYKVLSIIARQITGTRWSGPAFFGLKRNAAEANHGR